MSKFLQTLNYLIYVYIGGKKERKKRRYYYKQSTFVNDIKQKKIKEIKTYIYIQTNRYSYIHKSSLTHTYIFNSIKDGKYK